MPKFCTCLWFDGQAEQAAKHYTAIFPRSKISTITHYPEGTPGPAGTVMTVLFELDGQQFMGLNGGPLFKFSPAISIMVKVEDQAELDALNAKLIEGGGAQSDCGWVTDKFGLSWQLVPRIFDEMMAGDDARSHRVMHALLKMQKLDIAALKKAYQGE